MSKGIRARGVLGTCVTQHFSCMYIYAHIGLLNVTKVLHHHHRHKIFLMLVRSYLPNRHIFKP